MSLATPRVAPSAAWPTLIEAARTGDDEALTTIVRRLRSYLLAIAESNQSERMRPKFGASDVVQQSLVEATESIGAFAGDSEAELRAWMKRIVLHNLTDEARRYTNTQSRDAAREAPIDDSDAFSLVACPKSKSASWMISRRETNDGLLAAVGRLPDRQRRVVEERHRWGRSYRQIAAELDITENAARNLWKRAMQNLRATLVEHDGTPRRRARPTVDRR